ncbi:MAG: Hpt domain-containing protein [bacterium]
MENSRPDVEQQELLIAFVEEGFELLDEAEPLLIALETNSYQSGKVDAESLNTIFRLFHSLKGGAGFLGLGTVGKVTHEAETLLDFVRKGKCTIGSEHIDLLNRTCDFLRQLLTNIKSNFNDAGFDEEADHIKAALRQKIADITVKVPVVHEVKTTGKKKPNEKTASAELASAVNEGGPVTPDVQETNESTDQLHDLQLTITPEMIKQFTSESEDLLSTAEEALLSLEKEPQNEEYIGQAFRALHSFKGNAGFLGYCDLEKLSHQAETVLDKIRCGEIKGDFELFSLLLEILDFLREGVAKIIEGQEPAIVSLSGLINLMQDALNKAETLSKEKVGKAEEVSSDKPKSNRTEPLSKKSQKLVKNKQSKHNKVSAQANNLKKTDEAKLKTTAKVSPSSHVQPQRQTVRVDVEKLDLLLNLVGELVIAEAMVAQNPDCLNLDVSLDRFEKSTMHLNKITRDLQDISTSIRMIPLAGTFRRMIRLVRDLAQKTGKQVTLEIIGEDTEVDKTVIEKITDPLVHIIRNSIDHGIATPEVRKQFGKPETGRVTLEAKYAGGEVWISIKDDGLGLNREKILAKAIAKGLVDGDGAELRDEEVWPLIFQPGFSTADKVTDVSGRGVGMDVVRRNIENIRGKVEVRSQKDQGTEVILRIPLTLAIIDSMIIRVGKTRYTIPMVAIKESLQPKATNIVKTMDGQEILRIRDKLLPVVRLSEIFKVKADYSNLNDGIIVVVENAGKSICLFVDELIGQQQIVIKGLSEYVGNLNGISGCTILGNGDVSLIVDIAGLLALAEHGFVQLEQHLQNESPVEMS